MGVVEIPCPPQSEPLRGNEKRGTFSHQYTMEIFS